MLSILIMIIVFSIIMILKETYFEFGGYDED